MVLGVIVGVILHHLPASAFRDRYLLTTFNFLGRLFIGVIKILVVPVVFFSLVSGVCSLNSGARLGRIALKTIGLYLATTMFALTMALGFAWLFGVGRAQEPIASTAAMTTPPSLQSSLLRVIFSNPIHAFTGANMLQLILIAILVGVAIRHWRVKAEKLERFIVRTNGVLMMAILWFMLIAPYGIFCLVTVIFAEQPRKP